jgi:hypothetical protein
MKDMQMRAKQTGKRKDAGMRAQRRPRRGMRHRRPEWAARLRRLNRALASSWRVIDETMHAFERAAERAERTPLRTSRDLLRLGARLARASNGLMRAVRGLSDTTDSLMRAPEPVANAPLLLTEATVRWIRTAQALADSSSSLFDFHEDLLKSVRSGELVPEAETPRRRPRIVGIQHLISARDFLLCRRSSAHDRIATIPARRRRTACPATADAPPRISRGRAPPSFSNCLL